MIDRKILEILVCPITKTGLRYDSDHRELISDRAKKAFPIIDGIPILVSELARNIDARETKK